MARSAAETVAGIPELLRLIFDHASDVEDREAVSECRYAVLRRFALVNQTFAAVAQELLFARVYLCEEIAADDVDDSEFSTEIDRLLAIIRRRTRQNQVGLTPKLDLLSSVLAAAPHLAAYIRIARIVHVAVDAPALDRLLSLLPKLQALRIRLFDHHTLTQLDTTHLTRLGVGIGQPGALPALLAQVPALVELAVYDGTATSHASIQDDLNAALAKELPFPCKLRSLTLAFSHSIVWQHVVASWLMREAKDDLRELALSKLPSGHYDAFPPHLERFRWSPIPREFGDDYADLLTRLPLIIRHFTLGPFNCSKDLVAEHLGHLAAYLPQVTAIEHVHLIFGAGKPLAQSGYAVDHRAVSSGRYPGYVNIAHEGVLTDFMTGDAWEAFEMACETALVELSWTTEPYYEEPVLLCAEDCDQTFGPLWP